MARDLKNTRSNDAHFRQMSSGTMDSRFREKTSCGVWTGNREVQEYQTVDSKGRTFKEKGF